MKKQIGHVYKFHEAFGIANRHKPTGEIAEQIYELRHRLMEEENNEYLDAARRGDMIEIADALGDMMYILCGTILSHGMQDVIEEVFDEIQRSNMSKLDENGNPIYREDGKVMKSDLYFKPNIEEIVASSKNLI